MTAMFQSLGVRNYRLFAGGQLISLTGTWVQTVAQDWLVLELTGNSAAALGAVTALQFLPMMLLSMYAGLLADRLDKRTMLIVVQSCFAALALGMGLLVVSGAVQLWHVYTFALLLGIAQAFDTPARQAFVGEMVGADRLPNAVALNSATFNTARLAGPAAGGILIAAFDVGPAFLLNAATYVGVLGALLAMRSRELVRSRRIERGRGQIAAAVRFVRGRTDLKQAFLLAFVVGTMGMNFMLTLPLLAKVDFGVGAAQFGLLSSALAGGALVGALLGSRRSGRPSAWLHLAFAGIFGALEMAVAFAPTFVLAMLIVAPTGAMLIAHNNVANARVQLGVPAQLRGRVMALYMMVFLGGTPLGALIVGFISEEFGARAGILAGGLSVLLTALVAAVLHARRQGVAVSIDLLPRPRMHFTMPAGAAAEAEAEVAAATAAADRAAAAVPARPTSGAGPGDGSGRRPGLAEAS
jgi:MFS family permease